MGRFGGIVKRMFGEIWRKCEEEVRGDLMEL